MGSIRELFTNTWKKISLIYYFNNFSFLTLIYFSFDKLTGQKSHSEIYAYSLYIFLIKIRYSWILWKVFVNRNIIRQITVLANRNNIHEMLWVIGMGINLWPKYQQIDSWRIYLRTVFEIFADRELLAEHWKPPFRLFWMFLTPSRRLFFISISVSSYLDTCGAQSYKIFNRPGVAGAVVQSPPSLIHSVGHPLPPNHQDIINHKP